RPDETLLVCPGPGVLVREEDSRQLDSVGQPQARGVHNRTHPARMWFVRTTLGERAERSRLPAVPVISANRVTVKAVARTTGNTPGVLHRPPGRTTHHDLMGFFYKIRRSRFLTVA